VSARLLFTCWPFEGHVFPQMSIALAARAAGHEVAFYTGRRLRETVEAEGFPVFPFDRIEGVWEHVHERERRSAIGSWARFRIRSRTWAPYWTAGIPT